MEKKAEKEIEIILTPVEGGTGASEIELPTLVPGGVTGDVGSAEPDPQAEAGRAPALPGPKAEAGGTPVLPGPKAELGRAPTLQGKRYGKALLTVALLIGLFMIALPIKQSVIWYFNVRRPPARNAASLFGPAILGAWFGDPDSAYALQTLPFIMATHGKPNGESIASRNCTIKMLERFWQGPGDPQKALSRLGGSVALSSYGDIAEAVRQLRPVMKTGESQMLNFYNAILLANSGDLTGAMKESDEGSRLSETGKGQLLFSDKSVFYLLKAKIYQTMGNPVQALTCLNSPGCLQAAKDHPNTSDFAFAEASAYLQLGQPDKAISLVSHHRDGVHANFICATAYLMKDNLDKALSEVELIDLKDGNKREILLSRFYCKQGRLDQALLSAIRAEERSPNLSALEQRVFVLNKLGRYKEALAVSQNFEDHLAVQLESEELLFRFLPDLHAGRAEAYLKTGDFKNALQEAQQALKIDRTCLRALQVAKEASVNLPDANIAAVYENRIRAQPLLPTYR